MTKYTISILFFFVICQTSLAQYPIQLNFEKMDQIEAENLTGSIGELDGELSFSIPVFEQKKYLILLFPAKKTKYLDYRGLPDTVLFKTPKLQISEPDLPRSLYYFELAFGGVLKFGEDDLLLQVKRLSASDRNYIESIGDYALQALYTQSLSKNSKMKYGAYYERSLDQGTFVPLIGYRYDSSKYHLYTLFPSFFILNWQFHERFFVLWEENITTSSFKLKEKEVWNEAISQHFAIKSRIGLGIKWREVMKLSGGVGFISHRSFKFVEDPRNDDEIGHFTLPNQAFYHLSFRLVM